MNDITPVEFSKAVLIELALEIDNDDTIAKRHGLTVGQITWARSTYADDILKLATDMRDSGVSFRRKMAIVAEHHIPAFVRKMSDPNIGVGSFMDMFRTAAKYGELEPKENSIGVGAGTGFAINIVVNGQAVNNTAKVIDHQPTGYAPPDFDTLAILNPPAFLDSADISVNDELIALPLIAAAEYA